MIKILKFNETTYFLMRQLEYWTKSNAKFKIYKIIVRYCLENFTDVANLLSRIVILKYPTTTYYRYEYWVNKNGTRINGCYR